MTRFETAIPAPHAKNLTNNKIGSKKPVANRPLVATALFTAIVLITSLAEAGKPGFWYVMTSVIGPDGHSQRTDRVSNVFNSGLDYLQIQKRVRQLLNGYTGFLGGQGPMKTREEAEDFKKRMLSGMPETIRVPDPLE